MEYKAYRSWHKSAEQSGQVEGGEERRVGPDPGHELVRLYVELVGEKVCRIRGIKRKSMNDRLCSTQPNQI